MNVRIQDILTATANAPVSKAEIELLYTQSNLTEILKKKILSTFLLTGILIQ